MQQRTRHLDLCPLFGSTSKNTESYLAIASHPKNMVYGQILDCIIRVIFSVFTNHLQCHRKHCSSKCFSTEIRVYMQIFQMFKISN